MHMFIRLIDIIVNNFRSNIKVISDQSSSQQQNPLEVLQTMFSGGSGMPGAGGDNPLQQMASQLFSQVHGGGQEVNRSYCHI